MRFALIGRGGRCRRPCRLAARSAPTALLLLVVAVRAILPSASAAAAEPLFQAGSALAEITPAPGSPMAGYGDRGLRPSQGIHDRLYCRALVLQTENRRVALVSADLVGFTLELRDSIQKRLSDLPVAILFLAATHTHSGPGGYKQGWAVERFLMGKYSPTVFGYLSAQIASAVREAQERLAPARVAYGRGESPQLSRNRRHEGGEIDPEVGVLLVESLDGTPVALVVNFAAHPTMLSPENLLYSGDYAGMTSQRLEEALGVPALFFNGALGDQKPFHPQTREWQAPLAEQFAQAGDMAADLSAQVLAVTRQLRPEAVEVLSAKERWVDLPRVDLRGTCFYYAFTPLLRFLFRDIFQARTIFQAVRLNELALVGLPAELAAGLGKQIKQAVPARLTLIACLANDTLGYALAPEDYRTGGYEACMSFYGRETGGFFADQAQTTLRELW